MPGSQEKSHPMIVKATEGELQSCGKPNCEKWGSGVLTIEDGSSRAHSVAKVFLTMAGCEVCPGPQVTQRDLNILSSFPKDPSVSFEDATAHYYPLASQELVSQVDAIPMPDDTGWVL